MFGYAHGAIRWLSTDGPGITYTVSGLSFQPKAIRFYWQGHGSATDAASETLHSRRGVGFATGTSDRRCVGSQDQDAAGTTVCTAGYRTDCVAMTLTSTPAADGLLDLNSITSDGFTLIVDDQGVVDLEVFWEAWGGDDITVATTVEILEPAATGNQDITVTGFAAGATVDQVVMFAGVHATAAAQTAARFASGLCVGFAAGTGAAADNVVMTGSQDDASAATDTDGYCKTGECLAMITAAGGNPDARAQMTQWNADGFRLNWIARAVTNRKYIGLAIKGGMWKAGAYTIAGNSGGATATVSGLPFRPLGVSLIGRMTAEQAAGTSSAEDRMGLGSGSSTSSRRAMGHLSENATASSACEINLCIEYDQVLAFPSAAGALLSAYDINAMNADGFQIIVDTAGGVASEWQGYLTFGIVPLSVNVFDDDAAAESVTIGFPADPPLSVNVADAPAPAESAPVRIPMEVGPAQNLVNDSITVGEAVTVAIPMAVVVSDADAPTEALEIYLNPLLVAVFDTESVVDTVEVARNPLTCEVADDTAAMEAVTVAIPMQMVAFDDAPATEVVTIQRNPLLVAVADDDIPADAVTVQISVNVVVAEAAGETEAVDVTVNPLVPVAVDSDAVAEAIAVTVSPLTVVVAEDDVAIEAVAVAIPMQVAVADDDAVGELVSIVANPLLVDVSDADAPGESVQVVNGSAAIVSVGETVNPTESVTVALPMAAVVDDVVAASEVVAVALPLSVLAADGVLVGESAAAGMLLLVSVVDAAVALESALAILSGGSLPLSVSAVDSLTVRERRSVLSVGLTEAMFRDGAVGQATVTEEAIEA